MTFQEGPLDSSTFQACANHVIFSQFKHMLWVLERAVSLKECLNEKTYVQKLNMEK